MKLLRQKLGEYKQSIHKMVLNKRLDGRFLAVTAFLSCFLLSFVAGSLIIQPQGTKAVTGLGLVGSPTMSLSAGSSAVNLNITPTQSGTIASASQSLTTTTNVPTGYNLALSTPDTPALATTSGSITSPTTLANNTWGYALARNGAVGVINDFDSGYATPTPSTNSKWANPSVNAVIKNTSVASANDSTDIYFGAKVDATLPSGTYSNNVRYTATANIADIPAPTIISTTPSSGTTAGGTAITIVGTGFAVNDESVTTAVTIGGQACINPSISSNTPTTGQDTITCTTPAHAAATVDVQVTTWKSTTTKTDGYTYKLPSIPMQEITQETCSATKTLAYDVRDNSTYWVQKLADGRCWMLTNLAYGGGGTNTYGDAKSITNNNALDYTQPHYMTPTEANPTSNGYEPSISTDGGVSNPQYGYLYNWCAAMGVQTSTSACANATTPASNTSISICPSGWRLPTGSTGGEYQALNNAANGGSTSSPSGILSSWLGMYSGLWNNGFNTQGSNGDYWSSTQNTATYAYYLGFSSSGVTPGTNRGDKRLGLAVRCILDIPIMQEMTIDQCTNRITVAYDARDNRTYYVQKMADGKCWMLTNLAYAGGGTNTYGDTKTITEDTGGAITYTGAHYYTPTGANPTDFPTTPSTSTDGGATNPQYGYLYNWCAAMGIQTSTSACASATTPTPDTSISICPSGWRLPTGNAGGEFQALTDAIWATTNGSSGGTAGSTALRSSWLGMYSGLWNSGFGSQGSYGYYWSSTQGGATYTYGLYFTSSGVDPSTNGNGKLFGAAVRCVMADPVAKTGDAIQTVTTATCPTTRTRVNDARDNASYWIQKLADGKCWMLTNLAYGGGGTNTYGDTKSITNSNTLDYTQPYYMIPTGSNRTTGTTNPSTATSGTGQYGYLYNWCATMGSQTSTSACANATTPAPGTSVSICPSGWRLPTGAGGEYQALNNAVNGGSTSSPSGLLSSWLGMYSGGWINGFDSQGSRGNYWSSTQIDAMNAYSLYFTSSFVFPGTRDFDKQLGYAVRCIAV